MQLSIWITAISIVVGPVLLGLLLHRLGFSRAVACGTGAVLLGGAFLISNESSPTSTATSQTDHIGTVDRAANGEIAALRARVAELEREKAAHEAARRELDAPTAPVAALDATQQAAGPPRDAATGLRAAGDRLKEAELRLAIANAEIERLKTALRAAEPVATAAPLPATPQPFAHAPEPQKAPNAPPGTPVPIATGATDQSARRDSRSASLDRALTEAAQSRRMDLVRLTDDELVQGRRGSYYRIICSGSDRKPLSFSAGEYVFEAGYGPLATCLKAVQELVLGALPSNAGHSLYVQGYASQRGFLRPKTLPARDAHLRSLDYLPRINGRDGFSPAKARQKTGRRFTNTELPNLRAAHVAHWIDRATGGAVRPEILEGALKPGNDAASQSFALLLHVAW